MLTHPATCTARFPGSPQPQCDRQQHTDRMHVCCYNGVPFAWSDPDDGALDDWEAATLAAVRDVHLTAGPVEPDRVTAVLDAVEVLVVYWRNLPGGAKGTERFTPQIQALITAYDQLSQPGMSA